jgi:hypothetical protein
VHHVFMCVVSLGGTYCTAGTALQMLTSVPHYYYYLILLDRIKNIQSRKVLLKPPLDVGLGGEKIEYGC